MIEVLLVASMVLFVGCLYFPTVGRIAWLMGFLRMFIIVTIGVFIAVVVGIVGTESKFFIIGCTLLLLLFLWLVRIGYGRIRDLLVSRNSRVVCSRMLSCSVTTSSVISTISTTYCLKGIINGKKCKFSIDKVTFNELLGLGNNLKCLEVYYYRYSNILDHVEIAR